MVDVTFTFTTLKVHMWRARLTVVTVIVIGVCQIDAVVAIPTATSTSTDVEPSPPSSSLLSALPWRTQTVPASPNLHCTANVPSTAHPNFTTTTAAAALGFLFNWPSFAAHSSLDKGSWVSKLGLTSPSIHYRSFRWRVFPVNHLH